MTADEQWSASDGRPILISLVCGEAHGEVVAVQPIGGQLPRWCDWMGSRYYRCWDSKTYIHEGHTSEGQRSASSSF